MVMESLEHAQARGARIYGGNAGVRLRSDALDMSVIPEEAPGADPVDRGGPAGFRTPARDIRYINVHGTATDRNDVAEASAIRAIFPQG